MYKTITCRRCKVTAVVHRNSLCARLRLCIVHANDHMERDQNVSVPELKIVPIIKNPWSPEEVLVLKHYVSTKSGKEIADMLDRTHYSIVNRIRRLREEGELEW